MTNKLRILLTGASGTVGYEVLKQLYLLRNKFDITVFGTRSKRSLKQLLPYKEGIEIIYGNISDINDVRIACAAKDVVIHLAALIPPQADVKPELAYEINTVGTRNLVRSLEQLSPEAFFLYSSSISVYGDRLENPYIRVGDPLIPSDGDEYAKTKIEAEEIICSSKLDWSIFRLTAIMGNHKVSKLMFHMPLATSMEIASPGDTGRAFIHAIDKKEIISKKIFNLSGGEKCRTTYQDLLSRSFDIFGLGKLDFPNKAFAEKNFHCGYYDDGDELNNILHFRTETLDDYYRCEKLKVSVWKKALTYGLKSQIKSYLLKKSEPYQAHKTNDPEMIKRYFYV
jgi:nucleoside-diphosphate-sugar epimerase